MVVSWFYITPTLLNQTELGQCSQLLPVDCVLQDS